MAWATWMKISSIAKRVWSWPLLYGYSTRYRGSGAFTGQQIRLEPWMFQWSAVSQMGAANSIHRKSLNGNIYIVASFGQRSLRTRLNGNRHFLWMAAKPGKQTGSWSSSGHEQTDLFSDCRASNVHAPSRQ